MAGPRGNGAGNGSGTGMGWAAASARRKAIRQTMSPSKSKHGLVHAPTIQHSHDGTGTSPPKFGVGGGFKAGGF